MGLFNFLVNNVAVESEFGIFYSNKRFRDRPSYLAAALPPPTLRKVHQLTMKYNAFISYACPDTDIVENFRDHLGRLGVTAWVYSVDRTLASDTWTEIEEKIRESDLVIFIVSENTPSAEGQRRELDLAVKKVDSMAGAGKIMPIVITGTNFSSLPAELRNKNGFFIDSYKVKTVAWKVASSAFPSLMDGVYKNEWRFPVPGEWLF